MKASPCLHGDGWAGFTFKGRRGVEEESQSSVHVKCVYCREITAMRSGSCTTGQSSFIFRNPEVLRGVRTLPVPAAAFLPPWSRRPTRH